MATNEKRNRKKRKSVLLKVVLGVNQQTRQVCSSVDLKNKKKAGNMSQW